ncbi:MAG: PASTA domain-containing protein [Clostridia bacterium]|nr:PASTA domain-containing protein [Clostridia bacterium]
MENGSVSTRTIKRSTWLGIIICAVFAVLLIRILFIQTVKFKEYQDKVLDQITTSTTIPATRGNIYDRNGNILASNIVTYRVFISPSGIKNAMENREEGDTTDYRELVSTGLADTLGVDKIWVLEQIDNYSNKLDRTIKRKVDKETAAKVTEYISEHKLQSMIYLEAQDTRYYPNGTLAAHMIGFISGDGEGLYGLEYQYEEYLHGVNGYYITARDSYGNEMPIEYGTTIEAVDGYNLQTTIDISIQNYLEEQLAATVEKHEAMNRACGIVMDVNTGAILAMATSSPFDLNDPWELDALSQAMLLASGYEAGSDEYADYQRDLLTQMWSNKPVAESYIPGSTFKIITSSMALEEKADEIPDSVYCQGWLKEETSGSVIHCHKLTGHGSLSFAEGLQDSCNVWFMTLGKLIGSETFTQYVKAFGYREITGIDLPGEASGIFTSQMTPLDLVIYAFGQNFNVTPIQQITAVSAVANGGHLMTPYIVEQITDDEGNIIYQHETEVKRQVISSDVCEEISRILEEGVSTDGGAKNAAVKGYKIAAKTGTSEKKETGTTYVTVSDYKNKTIAEAKAEIEAAGLKCVAVGNSSAKVAQQSPKAASRVAVDCGVVYIYAVEQSSSTMVPMLQGKTLSEAKILLEEAGLNFTIENTGIHSEIIDQSVTSGMYVEKGSVIKITFPEGYICSTVAYAPADDPQVAIIIIVDEPTKGSLYGSTVAAPYVSDALENILPYLGIEKNTEEN